MYEYAIVLDPMLTAAKDEVRVPTFFFHPDCVFLLLFTRAIVETA
jgi:hypothetical protein